MEDVRVDGGVEEEVEKRCLRTCGEGGAEEEEEE